MSRTATTPNQLAAHLYKPVTPIDVFRAKHGIPSPSPQQLLPPVR